MGYQVNLGEISAMVAQMNNDVQLRIEKAVDVKATIYNYLNTVGSELVGDSYSTSKEFFEVTYIPLLDNMISTYNYFADKINRFVPVFNQYVPNPDGFQLDTDILGAHIDRLQREIIHLGNMIDGYYYAMATEPATRLSAPPDYYWEIYQLELQRTNCRNLIVKMEAVIQGIVNFNTSFASEISELIAQVEAFERIIASLENAPWNSASPRFEVPVDYTQILLDFEFEMMLNVDGTINEHYIHSLMLNGKLNGTDLQNTITLTALTAIYENADDLNTAAFLNACLVSNYRVTENALHHIADSDNIDTWLCLSPLFIEMLAFRTNNLPEGAFGSPFESGLTDEQRQLREDYWMKTALAGIMLQYGAMEATYIDSNTIPRVININWSNSLETNKNVLTINFLPPYNESTEEIRIMGYTDKQGMATYAVGITTEQLNSMQKPPLWTYFMNRLESTFSSEIKKLLTVALPPPLVATTYTLLGFTTAVEKTMKQNENYQNMVNNLSVASIAEAYCWEGVPYYVDGVQQMFYVTPNWQEMSVNVSAYNTVKETEYAIEDFFNVENVVLIDDYVEFCNYNQTRIAEIKESLSSEEISNLLSLADMEFIETFQSQNTNGSNE